MAVKSTPPEVRMSHIYSMNLCLTSQQQPQSPVLSSGPRVTFSDAIVVSAALNASQSSLQLTSDVLNPPLDTASSLATVVDQVPSSRDDMTSAGQAQSHPNGEALCPNVHFEPPTSNVLQSQQPRDIKNSVDSTSAQAIKDAQDTSPLKDRFELELTAATVVSTSALTSSAQVL